jgi:hypothetical protein
MSRLIATILLAILMFPLASVFYLVVFVAHEQLGQHWLTMPYSYRQRIFAGFGLAGLLTWLFIAVYWWLLWRRQIKWTPKRRLATIGWVGLALLLALGAGAATSRIETEFGAFIASVTAPLLWVFGSVLSWRESPAEHAARIASLGGADALTCPTCGYNLTGLKGTRCPECGNEFTLDQLLASQPARAQVELES